MHCVTPCPWHVILTTNDVIVQSRLSSRQRAGYWVNSLPIKLCVYKTLIFMYKYGLAAWLARILLKNASFGGDFNVADKRRDGSNCHEAIITYLPALEIFNVIFTVCGTGVPQNVKITRKIPRSDIILICDMLPSRGDGWIRGVEYTSTCRICQMDLYQRKECSVSQILKVPIQNQQRCVQHHLHYQASQIPSL